MKRLITTAISTSVGMPIKKGTLEFLQDSYKESIAASIKANIAAYDSSKIYIIDGLEVDNFTSIISSGIVFYNDEVYDVDGISVTGGINLVFANISISNFTTNADPTLFSDSATRNVHNIRKILLTNGFGTGAIDNFPSFIRILKQPQFKDSDFLSDITFKQNQNIVFDLSTPTGAVGFGYTFIAAVIGAKVNCVLNVGSTPVNIDFASADANTITIMSFDMTNPKSFESSATNPLCIEFEYLGTESVYNKHIVKVTINQTA